MKLFAVITVLMTNDIADFQIKDRLTSAQCYAMVRVEQTKSGVVDAFCMDSDLAKQKVNAGQ